MFAYLNFEVIKFIRDAIKVQIKRANKGIRKYPKIKYIMPTTVTDPDKNQTTTAGNKIN